METYSPVNLFDVVASDEDTKYTTKVGVPQYLPSNIQPNIFSIFDDRKYLSLINAINQASVSDDEKKFLKLAASRHIVFNYAKIADYYAHASKEMQELMEQSALVIIDLDDAIANGYVKLSKEIEKIMYETGIPAERKTK